MARRARRRSQEQELLNNNMENNEEGQNQGLGDGTNLLTMATLITALRAAVQPNPEPRKQIIKTPTYEGEGGVELFISGFLEVARENGWTDQESLIHLRGSLKGKARDCGKGDDMETLFLNLRTMFGLTLKQARDNLERIRKKPSQSYHEYGKDISNFVEIGYPNLARDDRDDIALDKYMRNLNDMELRKHLTTMRTTSIQEAVTLSNEFIALGNESKTRITAISEEQNMLLETLKCMQNTLKELQTGTQKVQPDISSPSYGSYPQSMMPGQNMLPGQTMLPGQMMSGMIPGQMMSGQTMLPGQMIPGQHRLSQNPFFPLSSFGHQDHRMYMPEYTGQVMPNQPERKNTIRRALNCYQCGGPHLKRNCPQMDHGVNSQGNSQTGKTQQTALNSEGPPQ